VTWLFRASRGEPDKDANRETGVRASARLDSRQRLQMSVGMRSCHDDPTAAFRRTERDPQVSTTQQQSVTPAWVSPHLSRRVEVGRGEQPGWLHGWFHFWITLQSKAPTSFAVLTGLAETSLALVLLLGVARRAGYAAGVVYSLLIWSVGEGFGGPYASGSTDVGTGIVYALLFVTLLVFAPQHAVND
jgi:uncharacterized membrane protein YphA (DoxX/SURF4 family)